MAAAAGGGRRLEVAAAALAAALAADGVPADLGIAQTVDYDRWINRAKAGGAAGGKATALMQVGIHAPGVAAKAGKAARDQKAGFHAPGLAAKAGRAARDQKAGIHAPGMAAKAGRAARDKKAGLHAPGKQAEGGRAGAGKGPSETHGVGWEDGRGWRVRIRVGARRGGKQSPRVSKSGFGKDEKAKEAAGRVAAAVFKAIAAAEAAQMGPAEVLAAAKAALEKAAKAEGL
jgi:hypothetical protein